ncbi:MAG: RNA methyltransferase [Gracilibacter sp. BRH_c7a]|nr:MAG: RNA methyltransferase [Gracilibacter sp. BRH_c7a]
MYRFKIDPVANEYFLVTGEELHHMIHVLRLESGDRVIGFNNSGKQYLGVIEFIQQDSAHCRIITEESPEVEAKTKVYLIMGLAKGEKMEWVIQKGTELGMDGLIPLRSKRSVVQLEGKKAQDRVIRWQRIASEAVKQSRRIIEPRIMNVSDWKDLKSLLPPKTQWVIPYEDEKTESLRDTLAGFVSDYPVAILIGPEGGFSTEEVEFARTELKATSVSLGPRILRTETAALAALTIVLANYGDLG